MFNNSIRNNKLTEHAMDIHKNDAPYKKADTIDFVITIVMVIIAVFAFRAFLSEPVQVSGESMTPTLLDKERMFVEKFTYWFETPQRGDIVICYYPESYREYNPTAKKSDTYVKRVIGLPGETVKITDGHVYVKKVGAADFEMLDETSYLGDLYINLDRDEITVPKGSVFVMGDNRNNSMDSRYPQVGPIRISAIVGKVHGVIFPFTNIRDLDEINYAQ